MFRKLSSVHLTQFYGKFFSLCFFSSSTMRATDLEPRTLPPQWRQISSYL